MSYIKDIELSKDMVKLELNEKEQNYLKAVQLRSEIDRDMTEIFNTLSEKEKKNTQEALSKQFKVPPTLSVIEVAKFLGVSPQQVRKYCASGTIKATRTLDGIGQWRIETTQFLGHRNWEGFLANFRAKQSKSKEVLEAILNEDDNIDD